MIAWINIVLLPPCTAEIYKYQKDGIWYYTDSPPAELPAGTQKTLENGPRVAGTEVDFPSLLADYPARNDVERAAAATVAVKSGMGFGSGFFISTNGHIITNKHVVRSLEKQSDETESRFRQIEQRIDAFDKQFAEERQRMNNFQSRLDRLKREADAQTRPDRRQSFYEDYDLNRRRFEDWREDFDRRYQKYAQEKKAFSDGRQNYDYTKSVADLAQSFTIILADNTEHYVRLVAISAAQDLALLKLDGYTTPALKPGDARRLAQSDPVYAIGNPARLQNSVTSGIFSGFENGFLQTNAQIYPGNSGGPLVDAEGFVLGINTYKKLTHKFEGLGFAIPIETALREFSAYLPSR